MEDNHVEEIIESLLNLYKKLEEKQDHASKETQTQFEAKRQLSLLCIFPKKILRKAFLFLDFVEDIPQVMLTCKLFNSVVRSRTFQVLLHSQATHRTAKIYNSAIISSPNIIEVVKIKSESEITTKEDALSQLKIAYNGRDFLANKLKKQDIKIEELNKEIGRLQDEIKMQKNIDSKGIEKRNAFEIMLENEKKVHADAQKNLISLQAQYKNEIDLLRNQVVISEKDRTELHSQKIIFKEEVLKLRQENMAIIISIAVYQDVLNKMKAYFEAMQEANLLKSVELPKT